MNIALAFWTPFQAEAVEDVTRKAHQWADSEPNVIACEVVKVTRNPEHGQWFRVEVALTMRDEPIAC